MAEKDRVVGAEASITPIQRAILAADFPHNWPGANRTKTPLLERAILFFIDDNGGQIEESRLIDLICKYWKEIRAISKHSNMGEKPNPNLIVSAISDSEESDALFRRIKVDDKVFVEIDASKRSQTNETGTSEREEPGSLALCEEETSSRIHYVIDDTITLPEFSVDQRFEDRLLAILRHNSGAIRTSQLVEAAGKFECDGNFRMLPLALRVRACLIEAKLTQQVRELDPDVWTLADSCWETRRLPTVYRIPEPYPGALTSERDVTIDELYEIVMSNKLLK